MTASRLSVNHDLSEANLPWARSLEEVDGQALVVPSPNGYLLFVNPFGDNGADLDGRILFASDNGPELLDLVQEQPDRTPYLQRADLSVVDLLPSEHPRTPNVVLTPMEVLTGDVHLAGTVTAVDRRRRHRVVGRARRLRDRRARSDGHRATSAVDLDLTALDLPEGLHTLELRLGAGTDAGDAARSPVVRRTFYVRVTDGEVELLAPGTAARWCAAATPPRPSGRTPSRVPELLVDPRRAPAPDRASGPALHDEVAGQEGRAPPRPAPDARGRGRRARAPVPAPAHTHVARGTSSPTTTAALATTAAIGVAHEEHAHPDGHRQPGRARRERATSRRPGRPGWAGRPAPRRSPADGGCGRGSPGRPARRAPRGRA